MTETREAEPLGITGKRLAFILRQIKAIDERLTDSQGDEADYHIREGLLLSAAVLAHSLGYPHGYRLDPKEPDWPVFFIQLPTGQCSWHMPSFPAEWDGHSTEEKYQRIDSYCEGEQ